MPLDGEPDKLPPPDKELAAIEKALAERQRDELKKYRDLHALETQRLNYDLKLQLREAATRIDAEHRAQREKLQQEQLKQPLLRDRMKHLLRSPAVSEKLQTQQKQADTLRQVQQQERKDLLALEIQTHRMEREALRERQSKQLKDVQADFGKERERYTREHQEAKRLLDDLPKKSLTEQFQPKAGPSF